MPLGRSGRANMHYGFGDFYRSKRVLLTGHTGFKGAWLAEWLLLLGAEVTGLALAPEGRPNLFDQLKLASRLDHLLVDIRDAQALREVVHQVQPDVVFHLAAQPLVRLSYERPVETYATNVMGTVHLLEALRGLAQPCAAVFITTDKCYENREWLHSYRETDPLGGHDPYSSSKACCELAITSWRSSFFQGNDSPLALASARAGNVLGGGDWAADRIVPDCVRALRAAPVISVRHPRSTRPWQHVLEPLSGYLLLGHRLLAGLLEAARPGQRPLEDLTTSFNFGPSLCSNRPVADLVSEILRHWPGTWSDESDSTSPHEASLLNLATDRAHHVLGWSSVWNFAETVARTLDWYRAAHNQHDMLEYTRQQIAAYVVDARQRHLQWAQPVATRP